MRKDCAQFEPRLTITRPDAIVLGLIVAFAAAVRFYALGDLSLWSDEVVTMMLAQRSSLSDLADKIQHWDATRAIMHPYLLHQWIAVFGSSEAAARSLSAVCGLVTVGLVYLIGRQTSDRVVALWAAWFAAISPLDVHHSREIRMYAWLVMITCASWSLLLSMRTSAGIAKRIGLWFLLTALVYSHPLGTLMVAALGAGYLLIHRESQLGWGGWILIQVAMVLAFLPWAPRYLDHNPEVLVSKLNLRYLLEWPEAFTGGRGEMVIVVVGLIAWGIYHRRKTDAQSSQYLLAWFFVPVGLLLAYSLVRHPIFGQRRYLLFVSPAYLILLARGVAGLRWRSRIVFGVVAAAIAIATFPARVFHPERSHYRDAAAILRTLDPNATIIVPTHGTRVCLGYYMNGWEGMLLESELLTQPKPERVWHVVPTVVHKQDPEVVAQVKAAYEIDDFRDQPGLQIWHMRRKESQIAETDRPSPK